MRNASRWGALRRGREEVKTHEELLLLLQTPDALNKELSSTTQQAGYHVCFAHHDQGDLTVTASLHRQGQGRSFLTATNPKNLPSILARVEEIAKVLPQMTEGDWGVLHALLNSEEPVGEHARALEGRGVISRQPLGSRGWEVEALGRQLWELVPAEITFRDETVPRDFSEEARVGAAKKTLSGQEH